MVTEGLAGIEAGYVGGICYLIYTGLHWSAGKDPGTRQKFSSPNSFLGKCRRKARIYAREITGIIPYIARAFQSFFK